MSRLFRRFSLNRSGSTAIEYAVMIGLIGVAGYMFVEGATQLNNDLVASTGSKVDTAWKRAIAKTAPAAGKSGLKVRHAKSDEDRARELSRKIAPAAGGKQK